VTLKRLRSQRRIAVCRRPREHPRHGTAGQSVPIHSRRSSARCPIRPPRHPPKPLACAQKTRNLNLPCFHTPSARSANDEVRKLRSSQKGELTPERYEPRSEPETEQASVEEEWLDVWCTRVRATMVNTRRAMRASLHRKRLGASYAHAVKRPYLRDGSARAMTVNVRCAVANNKPVKLTGPVRSAMVL